MNSQVLRELIALFKKLKTETKVNVVLITSAGSDFCKGIDLPTIINNGLSSRFDVLSETINCIRFVKLIF